MKLWLVITATVHNRWGMIDPKQRELDYRTAITATRKLVPPYVNVIIVENSCMEGSSYLDELGTVVYTKNNILNVPNKGIIEFLDIQHVIRTYNIADDDIVIKLTGRYSPVDSSFLERIYANRHTYDVWMKFFNVCTKEFMTFDCVMGFYATKARILKRLNPTIIGRTGSMEHDFAKYIRMSCRMIDEVEHLGLKCVFAYDGSELLC